MKPLQIIYIALFLAFTACSGSVGEETEVQLTPDERDRFRAIASAELDSIRPLLDSICEATFDDRVAIAVDSIVQRRLEEETRLRSRLGQTIRQ